MAQTETQEDVVFGTNTFVECPVIELLRSARWEVEGYGGRNHRAILYVDRLGSPLECERLWNLSLEFHPLCELFHLLLRYPLSSAFAISVDFPGNGLANHSRIFYGGTNC
ncbi:hypothetical protein AVEN_43370-1 [Araneus ventricosus]|uniref:Uncharacterized protein n=1 Tax=Araneus ventricosus TaxID=182803 RepID=A0A4Y2HEP3_ARAVE|nr:hypothetical protein AVEN_43370-1 [Araneus ventricosus]